MLRESPARFISQLNQKLIEIWDEIKPEKCYMLIDFEFNI